MQHARTPWLLAVALACTTLGLVGCTKHQVTAKTEHRITVDPITININLKVDKQIDNDFNFEDEFDSKLEE